MNGRDWMALSNFFAAIGAIGTIASYEYLMGGMYGGQYFSYFPYRRYSVELFVGTLFFFGLSYAALNTAKNYTT